jgi:hypothetical protein
MMESEYYAVCWRFLQLIPGVPDFPMTRSSERVVPIVILHACQKSKKKDTAPSLNTLIKKSAVGQFCYW